MLHPLLDVMDLCVLQFRIRGDKSLKIEIFGEDEGRILQGQMDD